METSISATPASSTFLPASRMDHTTYQPQSYQHQQPRHTPQPSQPHQSQHHSSLQHSSQHQPNHHHHNHHKSSSQDAPSLNSTALHNASHRQHYTPHSHEESGHFIQHLVKDKSIVDSLIHWYTPNADRVVEVRDLPSQERLCELQRALSSWQFAAFEFSMDELSACAYLVLTHALRHPDLVAYRIPDDELRRFIGTVQSLYQVRAAYHNFQHALDVVQATFYILVSSGILPPFEGTISSTSHLPHHTKFSPVSTLITPKHALAALVAALGHDAGHPGVTNAFLIGAKSTLARIYNDRSVLESFHSVATLSLLLDLWPGLFLADDVEESTDRFRQGGAGFRRVIADVILSTDMGLHFEFMEKFERLKTEVLEAATGGESKDTAQVLEKRRIMVLCMILKCADISNVARPFAISRVWSDTLLVEQRNQSVLEGYLDMRPPFTNAPTDERKPSIYNNTQQIGIKQQASGQIGFVDVFVEPLYRLAAEMLPGMQVAVDLLGKNKTIWQEKSKAGEEEEERRLMSQSAPRRRSSAALLSKSLLGPQISLDEVQEASVPESPVMACPSESQNVVTGTRDSSMVNTTTTTNSNYLDPSNHHLPHDQEQHQQQSRNSMQSSSTLTSNDSRSSTTGNETTQPPSPTKKNLFTNFLRKKQSKAKTRPSSKHGNQVETYNEGNES